MPAREKCRAYPDMDGARRARNRFPVSAHFTRVRANERASIIAKIVNNPSDADQTPFARLGSSETRP